jgi:hypothetical protein
VWNNHVLVPTHATSFVQEKQQRTSVTYNSLKLFAMDDTWNLDFNDAESHNDVC